MIKTIVGAYTTKPKFYKDKLTGKEMFIPIDTYILVNLRTNLGYFNVHTYLVKRGEYVIIV